MILGATFDVKLQRAQTGPVHCARSQRNLAGDDGGYRGFDRLERGACIDQRTQQHVAGDARGGVDPQVQTSTVSHIRHAMATSRE